MTTMTRSAYEQVERFLASKLHSVDAEESARQRELISVIPSDLVCGRRLVFEAQVNSRTEDKRKNTLCAHALVASERSRCAPHLTSSHMPRMSITRLEAA